MKYQVSFINNFTLIQVISVVSTKVLDSLTTFSSSDIFTPSISSIASSQAIYTTLDIISNSSPKISISSVISTSKISSAVTSSVAPTESINTVSGLTVFSIGPPSFLVTSTMSSAINGRSSMITTMMSNPMSLPISATSMISSMVISNTLSEFATRHSGSTVVISTHNGSRSSNVIVATSSIAPTESINTVSSLTVFSIGPPSFLVTSTMSSAINGRSSMITNMMSNPMSLPISATSMISSMVISSTLSEFATSHSGPTVIISTHSGSRSSNVIVATPSSSSMISITPTSHTSRVSNTTNPIIISSNSVITNLSFSLSSSGATNSSSPTNVSNSGGNDDITLVVVGVIVALVLIILVSMTVVVILLLIKKKRNKRYVTLLTVSSTSKANCHFLRLHVYSIHSVIHIIHV